MHDSTVNKSGSWRPCMTNPSVAARIIVVLNDRECVYFGDDMRGSIRHVTCT